ncbi:MAG: WG repeat-containing protein [Sphingobacteriales bacterium]|nr:MAG: WG repeat-containing protein [Sphingobacteriales bacterium]
MLTGTSWRIGKALAACGSKTTCSLPKAAPTTLRASSTKPPGWFHKPKNNLACVPHSYSRCSCPPSAALHRKVLPQQHRSGRRLQARSLNSWIFRTKTTSAAFGPRRILKHSAPWMRLCSFFNNAEFIGCHLYMKNLLLPVFLLLTILTAAQEPLVSFRKAASFSGDEACLLRVLSEKRLLARDADRYYLLHNGAAWLVDQSIERGDTLRRQLHITDNGGNCNGERWQIGKEEWILRGVYRPNPALQYHPYFEKFDPFSGDYAAAGNPGAMGFINTMGEWIIKPVYDALKPHALGIWVKNSNGVQLIDALGGGGQSDLYDEISTSFERVGPNDARFTRVKKDGKMGALGRNRRVLVPLRYDQLHNLSFQYLLGISDRRVVVLDPETGRELTPYYTDVRIAADRHLLEVKTGNGIQVIDPYGLGTPTKPGTELSAQGACSCGEPRTGAFVTLRIEGDSIVPCKAGSVTLNRNNSPRKWMELLHDTTLLFSNQSLGTLWDCAAAKPLETMWRNYFVRSVQGRLWVESAFEYDSLMPNGNWKEFMADRSALRETFSVRKGRITRSGVKWILRVPYLSPEGIAHVHRLLEQSTMKLEENIFILRKLIVAALNGDAVARTALLGASPANPNGLLAYYKRLLLLEPRR